jgi:hypothetical protein
MAGETPRPGNNGEPIPGAGAGAAPEGEGGAEPLGAQVLRRVHEHFSLLMQEYDEIMGVLEHEPVKGHLQGLLEDFEQKLTETEEMFGEHYGHLPEIEGAMGGEEGEKGMEETQLTDSGPPEGEQTPAAEAVEGMQNKRMSYSEMKALRAHWRSKGMCPVCGNAKCMVHGSKSQPAEKLNPCGEGLGIEKGHNPGEALERAQHHKVGKEAGGKYGVEGEHQPGEEAAKAPKLGRGGSGHANNTLGVEGEHKPGHELGHEIKGMHDGEEGHQDEDMGVEGEHNPGQEAVHAEEKEGEGPLKHHEWPHVKNAHKFLGDTMVNAENWDDNGRKDAYHHGKNMEMIAGTAMSGPVGPESTGIVGSKDAGFPEAEHEDSEVGVQEGAHQDHHPHRKACGQASKFFHEMSKVDTLEPDHRHAALAHHGKFSEMLKEADNVNVTKKETPGIEPGSMGEKSLDLDQDLLMTLKGYYAQHDQQMEELNKKMASIAS